MYSYDIPLRKGNAVMQMCLELCESGTPERPVSGLRETWLCLTLPYGGTLGAEYQLADPPQTLPLLPNRDHLLSIYYRIHCFSGTLGTLSDTWGFAGKALEESLSRSPP